MPSIDPLIIDFPKIVKLLLFPDLVLRPNDSRRWVCYYVKFCFCCSTPFSLYPHFSHALPSDPVLVQCVPQKIPEDGHEQQGGLLKVPGVEDSELRPQLKLAHVLLSV